jgi:hypothetical protein
MFDQGPYDSFRYPMTLFTDHCAGVTGLDTLDF